MIVILMGPQGSGKGTQAKLLAERAGFFHMETGKLFRKIAETEPEIRQMLNEGKLVPDDKTIHLIAQTLAESQPDLSAVVFDGFPRSLVQYEHLKSWLKQKDKQVDRVVYIDISEEETVRRLSARRTCRICGTVYNLITNPPVDGKCSCGGKLYQREDDKPESIKMRLELFNNKTKPIIELAKSEGKLININGERPIEEIFAVMVESLGIALNKHG